MWPPPSSGGGRPLEMRMAAVERRIAEYQFALEGRMAEVERHLCDVEQRLGLQAGEVYCSEFVSARTARAPSRPWEDDDGPDDDDPLCGFLAADDAPEKRRGPQVAIDAPKDVSRKDLLEVAEAQSSYQVRGSVWDACVFIGIDCLPRHANVGLMLSVLANIGVQVILFVIIWASFTEPSYNESLLKQMQRWRFQAHSYDMSDPTTRTSLASRVCERDRSLSDAGEKAEWAVELAGWLSGNSLELCIVAVFVWGLTVFQEILAAVQFLAVAMVLPWGSHTHIITRQGKLQIRTMSGGRVVLMLSIALLRLAISFVLLYVGSVWLVNTSSPTELILNAVALNFLLQTDELVYDVLSPTSARALLDALDPIPLKHHYRVAFSAMVAGAWIVLPLYIFFMIKQYMLPYQSLKARAMKILCGGMRDFVFGVDALGRVVYALSPKAGTKPTPLEFQQARVVYNILTNSSDEKPAIRMDLGKLSETLMMTTSDLTRFWECKDDDEQLRRYAVSALGLVSNDRLKMCADAKRFCLSREFSFARAICPRSCGCADPLSGLLQYQHGCPRSCLMSTDRQVVLQQIPCNDHPLLWLRSAIGWDNFLKELPNVLGREWKYSQEWIVERAALLRDLGCEALKRPKVMEIGFAILCGPLASLCPAACSCPMTTPEARWFCPTQCGPQLQLPALAS